MRALATGAVRDARREPDTPRRARSGHGRARSPHGAGPGARQREIKIEAGGHPDRIFIEAELIVLSPGVPKIPQVLAARRHGVPVISELELGWLLSHAPFIGVTRTNGKSTVTTLVGLMLKKAGKKVLVAGNIGIALTETPELLLGQDWIVVELSSFQLEDIDTFRPAWRRS